MPLSHRDYEISDPTRVTVAFLLTGRLLGSAVTGPQYLRQPEIAAMVVEAIRFRDPGHYQLHSFVVMSKPRPSPDYAACTVVAGDALA